MNEKNTFTLGFLIGFIIGIIAMVGTLTMSKRNRFYDQGVIDTQKEAIEMGLMSKEVHGDGTVYYSWIKLPKIGYE